MSTTLLDTVGKTVKHWYIPFIVGLLMVGVSVWTFMSPMESYMALSIVFSVSFLISGLLQIYFAIENREMKNWGWVLAVGILSFAVGVLLVRDPQVSMATLPFYVGFALMFQSISSIGYAYDLKDSGVMDWGNLLAMGILGLLFSFLLIWNPMFSGMTIVIWTGLAFLFSGIYVIYLSLKLKKIRHKAHEIKKRVNEALDTDD